MGKRSAKKTARRVARKKRVQDKQRKKSEAEDYESKFLSSTSSFSQSEHYFQMKQREAQAILKKYRRLDVFLALSVSDLWPPNAGNFVKHIFAWRMLFLLPEDDDSLRSIDSYEEFSRFLASLYDVLPEFPMLEDFCPETDWGEVRIRLDGEYVPMFYGSCIERTPDFIEAFRINYAGESLALADMDLAIAIQSHIINSCQCLSLLSLNAAKNGNIEIPDEKFWIECEISLLGVGVETCSWRENASLELDVIPKYLKEPVSFSNFSDQVMQGSALPIIATDVDGIWIPLSIRNIPSVVIDFWAECKDSKFGYESHYRLSQFISRRFSNANTGPLKLIVDDKLSEDFTVSCVVTDETKIYILCLIDFDEFNLFESRIDGIFSEIKDGGLLLFKMPNGRTLFLSKDGVNGPQIDEIQFILILGLDGTSSRFVDAPRKPLRLFFMADFISIFDSLKNMAELERYWKFVDSQSSQLFALSRGASDLFAAFRDSDEVLIEGADSPSMIFCDPHWGTAWRYRNISNYWELAPDYFPDGSAYWKLERASDGVVTLSSHYALVRSINISQCTFQVLIDFREELTPDDARMLDLFAQILSDSAYRNRDILGDLELLEAPYVLVIVSIDPNNLLDPDIEPQNISIFEQVVTGFSFNAERGILEIQINPAAVYAGLHQSDNAAFEIRCLWESLISLNKALDFESPLNIKKLLFERVSEPTRFRIEVMERQVDVPDYVEPIVPTSKDYKLARKLLAVEIKDLGLSVGRYELSEAKAIIDPAKIRLRKYIEKRISSFNRDDLLKRLIEQNDACKIAERQKIMQAQVSLSHQVDFDRVEMVEKADKDFGCSSRHYRYLLEKSLGWKKSSQQLVKPEDLAQLVGLVDWYKVLTGASDYLHNKIDAAGVEIDDSFIPEVFYSSDSEENKLDYSREFATYRLRLGAIENDSVRGDLQEWLESDDFQRAFVSDTGFEYKNLIASLNVLSKAYRHGFGECLALSYSASERFVVRTLIENIQKLDEGEALNIVNFLTLSGSGILTLSGIDGKTDEVPFWEHHKRIHRYAIRPLIKLDDKLYWGAETVSRALVVWCNTVIDGYLPADFDWPNVKRLVNKIKVGIEKDLELKTEEIFKRYAKYVRRGIDFNRKFKNKGFKDVGDFDVFAYWPDLNLLVSVECKYNLPPFTIKDGRRLKDKIFGQSEDDRKGQMSRILGRRRFVEEHRATLLELLGWPEPFEIAPRNIELYVSRDVYYWMVNPPYSVQTKFVRSEVLDSWIKKELLA